MKNGRIIDIALGAAFITLGILSLNRPIATLGFLVSFFGVLAVARGISAILGLGSMASTESKRFRILLGVLDVIVGVIFLTNLIRGALFLGIMFAVWFLIESVGNLFLTVRFTKVKGFRKIFVLLFDIICMVFAVMMFFNPLIATITLPKLVGFSALAFGVVLVFNGLTATPTDTV